MVYEVIGISFWRSKKGVDYATLICIAPFNEDNESCEGCYACKVTCRVSALPNQSVVGKNVSVEYGKASMYDGKLVQNVLSVSVVDIE